MDGLQFEHRCAELLRYHSHRSLYLHMLPELLYCPTVKIKDNLSDIRKDY